MDHTTLTGRDAARFEAVSTKIISDARRDGIAMTESMVARLPSAVVATLTESALSEAWAKEARDLLPEYAEQAERNELRAKLESGDEEALDQFAGLSPQRRISAARAAGLDGGRKVKTPTAPEGDEKVRALRHVMTLPASARIAAARKLGLTL
ncbi:hypothetical protein SAMN04488012_12018 [Palleronia salina]|uniref:Uncharacterized protein n=1 Tax=Palleronia salina TaxID=313368 RepID=A0A1M6M561_9RHOB|nr:hypothetical protein [Palleronia salina]SHJ78591.1 hypothetical protein SAMN04488012_12018 [Palleronia salina]